MLHRVVIALCILIIPLAACQPAPSATATPPPNPLDMVTHAAENVRTFDSFRMQVNTEGAPYFIATQLGNVQFRRAVAQYVAPNLMQANVRLIAAGLPIEVDVFSKDENQWYRNDVLTANRWYNNEFSPGFNPRTLIAEETGFQASLKALINMVLVGTETLEDGSAVYHLSATARGEDVTALLAGLIYMTGTVNVDVYIHQEKIYPVRFVIVQPETVSDTEPDPTKWTIDIYDLNQAAEIDDPEAEDAAVTTVEAVVTPAP